LTRTFGDRFTLGPLDLVLGPGVTCLVGPNGAGKTTFFRLVAGLEVATAGSVARAGDDGASVLGFLPQDPSLPPQATCEQFLYYVAWLQRIPRSDRGPAVARALASVGLSDSSSQAIRTLSGGMARRLGIAHALVHDPGLVLLDEPTSGLDPRQRVRLRETVRALASDRMVLVSTHLVEDVRGLADRVLVLNDGTIMFDGNVPALEALDTPDAPGDTPLERAITALMGDGS
jgi:ABC-2 type transport system ATP-binding protein